MWIRKTTRPVNIAEAMITGIFHFGGGMKN
jgi:hypothetical protein